MTEIKTNYRIAESLFLASIPFLSYALTHSFESNYLGYFLIPNDFISLNIINIIYVSGIILALLSPAYILLFIVPYDNSTFNSAIGRSWLRIFVLALLAFVPDFLIHYRYKQLNLKYLINLWPLFLILLVFILLEFGFRVLKFWDKNYKKNIIDYVEQEEGEDNIFKDSVGGYVFRNHIGLNGYIILIIIFFLFNLSSKAGLFEAKTKQTFLIVNEKNAVVRINSDYLISVPFEKKNKKI
jgi:hypothetical protein